MSRIIIYLFLFLIIACSKNSLVYEEIPEELLYSCVDYSRVTDPSFDSDDLYAFWDIFVADAKCSMNSSPDYDKLNKVVDMYYEYESAALFASGEVLDYGAYAASSCNDETVRVGIAFRYWNDINIWQKLGLMYHEFGHDVLRFAHSSSPDDIMHASSPFANTEVVLFVPELVYFTYKVAGFEASAFATTSNTSAVTPPVAPVIVVPTNSDK